MVFKELALNLLNLLNLLSSPGYLHPHRPPFLLLVCKPNLLPLLGFFGLMLAAVGSGDAQKLAELIRQDPGFDVNMDHEDGETLLHHACNRSFRSPVIPLLQAHPDIDVNVEDKHGQTPFYLACFRGHTSCVRELLKDSRVKVNEPKYDGQTPLRHAAYYGHFGVIKWWIASGREMYLGKPGDIGKTDAIGVAKDEGEKGVVTLLERFQQNPEKTRHQARLELGWYDEMAAEIFALVVFVSDGLLEIRNGDQSLAARFFDIARRLPLELQMVLCHRVVGLDKEIIPGKDSEMAFKSLAKRI